MKRWLIPGILAVAPLLLAAGQAFDVASVKPNLSGGVGFSMGTSHGRLTATNVPVRMLILKAFHAKEFQVSGGPGWLGTERYDVVAKTDDTSVSDDDLWLLLQPLFADRFKLRVHRETKQLQVYALGVSKGGPKLKVHSPGTDGKDETKFSGRMSDGKMSLTASKMPMTKLADLLGERMDRTVIDRTGLRGEYGFKLDWAQEHPGEQNSQSVLGSLEEGLGLTGPSIFTAVEGQLGLKLESSKGSVELIVIDGAEKAGGN